MAFDAIICRGLQDASGLSDKKQKAFEVGNVELQAKALSAQGFKFKDYLGVDPYWGTLNLYVGDQEVDPETYSDLAHADRSMTLFDRQMETSSIRWDTQFYDLKWHPEKPLENLFLLKGSLLVEGAKYPCCIYFPNPTGATATYHPATIIEIIAPPISFTLGKAYGQRVTMAFPDGSLTIKAPLRPQNGSAIVPVQPI